MATVLIVDDEADIREMLKKILSEEGYKALTAEGGKSAVKTLRESEVDAMLLDIKMPGMDGMQVLAKAKEIDPRIEVLMISAHGDLDTAVQCVRQGAYTFIPKPPDTEKLLVDLANAIDRKSLRRANRELQESVSRRYEILGDSEKIRRVRETIDRVAPTNARIFVTGENGTGKELVARSIHYRSPRAQTGAFVDVNCAAIPGELIESELFGHVRGAFTGATEDHAGKFALADKGTIFLDEIGDMSLEAQAKVLRVLEENEIRKVGGSENLKVDARVVAATNKDLEAEVAGGAFRQDLLYRLNVVPIVVPPLRERREDIAELARHFLVRACRENGLPTRKISNDALRLLSGLDFPGNVRQLKNLIERLVVLSTGEEITEKETLLMVSESGRREEDVLFSCRTYEEFKDRSEHVFIQRKLEENGWNVSRTAEELGMQRSNLHKKIAKYGLKKRDLPSGP